MAKTYPGKDCGTDHQLLVAEIAPKLKIQRKPRQIPNIWHLGKSEAYKRAAKENHSELVARGEVQGLDAEEMWIRLKSSLEAAEEKLEKPTKTKREWISDDTWEAIQERKNLKSGLEDATKAEQYRAKSREVKKRCGEDNRYIEEICNEIEQHENKNEVKDMFQKIKAITQTFESRSLSLKSKEGNILTNKEEVKERWREYCEETHERLDRLSSNFHQYNFEYFSIIYQNLESIYSTIPEIYVPQILPLN